MMAKGASADRRPPFFILGEENLSASDHEILTQNSIDNPV
jgi:hypothetical protein